MPCYMVVVEIQFKPLYYFDYQNISMLVYHCRGIGPLKAALPKACRQGHHTKLSFRLCFCQEVSKPFFFYKM